MAFDASIQLTDDEKNGCIMLQPLPLLLIWPTSQRLTGQERHQSSNSKYSLDDDAGSGLAPEASMSNPKTLRRFHP